MYPIYLVGFFVALATTWAVKGASALPAPTDAVLYFFLLQSWVPSILESGLVYLTQCWFLSCLVFYWCIFFHIFDLVQSLTDAMVLQLTGAVSVALPLLYELVTFTIYRWSEDHQYLSVHKGVDVAVVVLKFHPLSYLHIFVLGCCVPRLREILQRQPFAAPLLPWVCAGSYAALLAVYCTVGDQVPGYLLSFRLGLVSIVQCALLIGLCSPQDWVARLFCHPLLKQFGLYGYPQYIFQFIAYAWFNFATKKNDVDIRYFLLLFATAVVSWKLVSPFNGAKMMNRFALALLPFLVVYAMLQPFLSTYQATSSPSNSDNNVFNDLPPSWWTSTSFNVKVANNFYSEGTDDYAFFFVNSSAYHYNVDSFLP
jgi:hypothetical protein